MSETTAVENLAIAMQGFGVAIKEATERLTFAPKVAKALANVAPGGHVFVWTNGATDENLLTEAAIIDAGASAGNDLSGMVATIDATTDAYGRVRSHVKTFLDTRNVSYGISLPQKDDDGRNIGFVLLRK